MLTWALIFNLNNLFIMLQADTQLSEEQIAGRFHVCFSFES